MNKILLIIKREYLTRVKKKSFIIMTILGPILMASIFIAPFLINKISEEKIVIEVIDEIGIKLPETENITFDYKNISFEDAKANFRRQHYYAILYMPMIMLNYPGGTILYSKKDVNLSIKEYISNAIGQELYEAKLASHGIDKELLRTLKTDIQIRTIKATEKGEEKSESEKATMIGLISGALIYFFIFLYGAQVMRGIIEEKTNRIVEIIISSVKPFQLMMGKILGVAMVGLTQFLLWVILTAGITTFFMNYAFQNPGSRKKIEKMMVQRNQQMGDSQSIAAKEIAKEAQSSPVKELLGNINFPLIVGSFIFFFLGGYLLYGALFAAIGAAVDSETDVQQFMLPITIPLILSFIVAQSVVMTNPDGALAFWFSIIPFTSPIVMMVRIPFGVPVPHFILSVTLLIAGFIFTTWLAAKIYRTGILMYGKKITYKELAKWLFYKE